MNNGEGAEQMTKEFQGTIAVDQIALRLFPQEALGLIAGNASGKSTPMKFAR